MKYLLASLIAAGLMGVVAPVVAASGVISYYPEFDGFSQKSYYCLAEGQPDSPCYPTDYQGQTFDCPNKGSLPINKQGGMGTPKELFESTFCSRKYICTKKNNHKTNYFKCDLDLPEYYEKALYPSYPYR